MRTIKEIHLGESTVQIRELTLREVDALLTAIRGQQEPTTLDWLAGETRLPAAALETVTGLSVAELIELDLSQSELKKLYEEAEELNPFLSEAVAQMRRVAQMEALQTTPGLDALLSLLSSEGSTTSGTTPSPSSAGSVDSLVETMDDYFK